MSAECEKHGCDLYWRDGEYNAPSGCHACDLERAEDHVETLTRELRLVRAKNERLKDELRHKQENEDYQGKVRRAQAIGMMGPCGECGRPSRVTVVANVRVHRWCYDHAMEYFLNRIVARKRTFL